MSTTPIIALDDVKGSLPIRTGNTTFDVKLAGLILVASEMIEDACGQSFGLAERTEYHTPRDTSKVGYDIGGIDDGIGSGLFSGAIDQTLVLKSSPVVGEVQVFYDTSRVFGEETEVPADALFVDLERGQIIVRWSTRRVKSAFKVVYSAGYAIASGTLSASAPANLKLACALQTVHLFNRSSPEEIGAATREENGAPVEIKRQALVGEARDLLRGYRRVLTGRA